MFETSESQSAYQITSSGLTCKASLHILRYARPSEWGRVPAVSFDVGAVGSVAGRPAVLRTLPLCPLLMSRQEWKGALCEDGGPL